MHVELLGRYHVNQARLQELLLNRDRLSSKLLDTLKVFLEEYFKKVNFEKKTADVQKIIKRYPACNILAVVLLLMILCLIVTLIVGFCNCSTFCCALLCVHSSFAIILFGKRELVALPFLSS